MSNNDGPYIPSISSGDNFNVLTRKIALCIVKTVDKPLTFEEFRTTQRPLLTPFARYLYNEVTHPALVAALMALKGHFLVIEDDDAQGINAARSFACEALALRYILHLSERELIDSLLYELPPPTGPHDTFVFPSTETTATESSPLLGNGTWRSLPRSETGTYMDASADYGHTASDPAESLADQLQGLNALEIAAVSEAKKFLSQKPVQSTINAIWVGDIVFWPSMSADSKKHAQVYHPSSVDPYCRLRVPKYLKMFEVVFFLTFLAIYYVVLVQRSFDSVTTAEVFLYIWLTSFAYNEFGEFLDAGVAFYLSDFWTWWDVSIVAIGVAFFITRVIGLSKGSHELIDTSFDILSMEALVLVPRIFSLLSLHPYFGVLLPSLREMTKDFIKFLSLVVILYLGFLTTFSLLARGNFTFRQMSWILIKVFFGSSYLGFDIADKISPILGAPLMLIFVCMTNILLITSLISILSNSLTKVIEHARDEYLFVYSVFVLEASTSNRLTYFLPPLNLIPLGLRPLRIVLPAETLRSSRIQLLKITHFPHVCAIAALEKIQRYVSGPRSDAASLFGLQAPSERFRGPRRHLRANRLSTPRPASAANLKPSQLLQSSEDSDSIAQQPAQLGQMLEQLQEAVGSLAAQVERLSAQVAAPDRNDQP